MSKGMVKKGSRYLTMEGKIFTKKALLTIGHPRNWLDNLFHTDSVILIIF